MYQKHNGRGRRPNHYPTTGSVFSTQHRGLCRHHGYHCLCISPWALLYFMAWSCPPCCWTPSANYHQLTSLSRSAQIEAPYISCNEATWPCLSSSCQGMGISSKRKGIQATKTTMLTVHELEKDKIKITTPM